MQSAWRITIPGVRFDEACEDRNRRGDTESSLTGGSEPRDFAASPQPIFTAGSGHVNPAGPRGHGCRQGDRHWVVMERRRNDAVVMSSSRAAVSHA